MKKSYGTTVGIRNYPIVDMDRTNLVYLEPGNTFNGTLYNQCFFDFGFPFESNKNEYQYQCATFLDVQDDSDRDYNIKTKIAPNDTIVIAEGKVLKDDGTIKCYYKVSLIREDNVCKLKRQWGHEAFGDFTQIVDTFATVNSDGTISSFTMFAYDKNIWPKVRRYVDSQGIPNYKWYPYLWEKNPLKELYYDINQEMFYDFDKLVRSINVYTYNDSGSQVCSHLSVYSYLYNSDIGVAEHSWELSAKKDKNSDTCYIQLIRPYINEQEEEVYQVYRNKYYEMERA